MSYPFYGKTFVFSQPDGTRIEVRGWGDQHHAVFESLDGYTLVKDPDSNFYCYAGLSDDREELVSTSVKVGVTDPALLGLSKGLRIKREAVKQKALMAYGAMGALRTWWLPQSGQTIAWASICSSYESPDENQASKPWP